MDGEQGEEANSLEAETSPLAVKSGPPGDEATPERLQDAGSETVQEEEPEPVKAEGTVKKKARAPAEKFPCAVCGRL